MGNTQLHITDLLAASGKEYRIDHFAPDALQYVDREYVFDHMPEFLEGAQHIRTAGDDKMIDENDPCLSFRVNVPSTIYIVYGDKLRALPSWLREFTDTREKVTRDDSDTTTLKGIFTIFSRDFEPGQTVLNGNLAREMRDDPMFVARGGGTYCMYSVVVAERM